MAEKHSNIIFEQFQMDVTTVAALPGAGSVDAGTVKMVSDAEAGNYYTLVVSNGTNWVNITTGATVGA